MATIPAGNPGLAQGVDQESFKDFPAFMSNTPVAITHDVEIAGLASAAGVQTGKTFALYEVVKFDTDGRISGAADNVSGSHADGAVAIMAGQVKQPDGPDNAAGETIQAVVYIQGHFNIDALVWNETTFSTDALKLAAFNGAPNAANGALAVPFQNILVGRNEYHRKS